METDLLPEEELRLKRLLEKEQITGGEELFSGLSSVDQLFSDRGGLRFGQMLEWGAPPGRLGRLLILRLLKQARVPGIWIHGHEEGLEIFPPAWKDRGLDLEHFYFLRSEKPMPELRPIFLYPEFKMIVLDCPQNLSKGDWSFIHARIRENRQLLFVLRPYFLSRKRGNPLAKFRLNCWPRKGGAELCLNIIKGGEGQLHLPLGELRSL